MTTKQTWRIVGLGRKHGAIGCYYPVSTMVQSASKPTTSEAITALHNAGYEVNYIASMGASK